MPASAPALDLDTAARLRASIGKLTRRLRPTAAGAAAGALLFNAIGRWCFALPPIVALLTRITAKSSLAAPTGTSGPHSATT